MKNLFNKIFLAFLCTIASIAVHAQVTVTYRVDITGYLAGGATLGANGIRIGGNFAALGTTLPDWTPSAAPCGMINTGNNIWSISVTYPAASVGQTQLYKFVNNDWGTNEGGGGSTIATDSCGASDGGGNINRNLVIPSQNTTICFNWDACTTCQTSTGPVVTTATGATAITATSASVAGTATGTGITARGVCYSTTQNPTIANSLANAGTGEGAFTASLTGLTAGTTYYARAFATNAGGTSYGAQISFTTTGGSSGTTVDVTYRVDVTNYIAAGNTIGAGGIRIAGDFADRGARVGNTPMVNWTPTHPAGAMTNSGNNVWTITVTYPDSSKTKTQTYKFVNNDWGTNEGLTDSTIASGGCGFQDVGGNINRTFIIPATNQTLTYCWDKCTACPLIVTTASPATAITANSASVSGTATGTDITARGVCYATTQNPTIANTVVNTATGTGIFTASLTGLTPSTTYFAKAFAINATGIVYGSQISFTTPGPSVDVTYRVDVSNYIAAGNSIGPGGIRIAGNFGDLGAKVNGFGMVNLTPTNPTGAMNNSGNNVWTIKITYPNSSIGLNQIYKFVNNDWGTNEGLTSSGIITGGCGAIDGPSGSINRTFIIPATNQTLTYCWDQCTACSLNVTTASPVTAITANSASVSGTATGTDITARGVCYATTQNPTIANSVANAGTGAGAFTASLTGLTAGTTYYARAFATNAGGTSYGIQISFTTPENTVDVTYRVDVTNYLAGGATIGAGGIRIAGDFADRGAKVGNTAMVNWTPTHPAGAMTNSGNNVWTITITYPDSSKAKTQTYKFVNNDWGTNEGLTDSSIVSGDCGFQDGGGNINRTFIIPATNQTLTYCWDQCTACSTSTALTVTTAASATAVTATSASVAGTATGTGITVRGVCYATTQNPTITNTVANAGTGEGAFTASLTGLTASTLYYARAFAITANDTAYGAQISFTTTGGSSGTTVDVTYRVNVTNYIAEGNTIGTGGIRIAGNFADRGAKVGNAAMVNWTPTDTAGAMTNSGNNIWTITVTYPDTSAGKTQTYKFVNNNWGTNEGLSGTGIVTGGCGEQSGANVNRTLNLPSSNAIVAYCWDQCAAVCITSVTPDQDASLKVIYPNPFSESFQLESREAGNFRIYSVSGQKMLEGNLQAGLNLIRASTLPNGLYFLHSDGMPVQKIEKR